MTESTPVSTAEKREWLRSNGYEVGTRGKLSADHERAFEERRPASSVPAE